MSCTNITTIRSKACKSLVSGDGLCIAAAGHRDRRSTSYCEFITGQRFIASVFLTVLQPILNNAAVVARRRRLRSGRSTVAFVSWDARETRQQFREKWKINPITQYYYDRRVRRGVQCSCAYAAGQTHKRKTLCTRHLCSAHENEAVVILMLNGQ